MDKYKGHTPGPWEVETTDNGFETDGCGPIKARYCRDNDVMLKEALANAQLIADAPMLAEQNAKMLEFIKDWVETSEPDGNFNTRAFVQFSLDLIAEIEEG